MRILVLTLLFSTVFTTLCAQNNVVVDSNLWQPDGTVYKTLVTGDTLIIGGDFNLIGKNTPYTAAFDGTGKLINAFPHANGEVKKAIPDGKNGFYIVGDFTKVGGEIRGGLAHIDSSGTVTSFFKNQAVNGYINDLEVKDSNLYIGGNFTGVNEYTGGGALVNYNSKKINSSFPKVEGVVYASEPDGDGGVYIGGKFTKVGEFYRENIAHIAKDGRVTAWNPKADGEVRAIACSDKRVFVGGFFNYIGCEKRHRFAAFEKKSNTPDTLQFSIFDFGTNVFSLEVYGNKVYIGTGFSFTGSAGGDLYAVDLSTNKIVFHRDQFRDVNAIKGVGGAIYIGTEGLSSNSGTRLNKVDTTNGFLSTVLNNFEKGMVNALENIGDSILVVGTDGLAAPPLFALNVATNNHFYADYHIYNKYFAPVTSLSILRDTIIICSYLNKDTVRNSYLNAFGTFSKKRLNWDINSATRLSCISVLSDSAIFCGGSFKTIGGEQKLNIAALNTNTSEIANWSYIVDREVHSVEVADSSIYISGYFSKINNLPVQAIARLLPNSGSISNWNTNITSGNVLASKIKGDTIFIGGAFDTGSGYINFAALNRHTGSKYTFSDIKGSVHIGIQDFLLDGNNLYILGYSNLTVNGIARNSIALVDANTGALQPFNPSPIPANFLVGTFALWKNNIVCGGYMSPLLDKPRIHVRILDANTGVEKNNAMLVSDLVTTLATTNDDKLFLGGRFMLADAKERNHLAMIDLTTGEPLPWNPKTNGGVIDMTITNGKLHFAGSFNEVNGQTRNYLASTNLNDSILTSWNPNANSPVGRIHYSNGRFFIGGSFTSVGGQSRKNFTSVDALTGQVSSLNPFSSTTGNIAIYSISSFNNDVYVTGLFTSFNGIARDYFASFNGVTNTLNPINLSLVKTPLALIPNKGVGVYGSTVYVTGNFTKSGSMNTPGFVRFNASTKIIDPWAPNTNQPLGVYKQLGSNLFLGLAQARINNKCRCNVSILDTSTKKLLPWHPSIGTIASSANVYSYGLRQVLPHNNKVYMSGSFKRFDYEINNNLVGINLEAVEIEQPSNKDFCLGGEMKIPLITSGNFDTANRFILVMSDTLGNFKNPLYLDTIADPTDTFLYYIPKTFTIKNDYRLKVISTKPNLQGREEVFINILPEPKADFTINDPYQCLYKNTFIFNNNSNMKGDLEWGFGDSSSKVIGLQQMVIKAYKKEGIFDASLVLKPYGNGCPNDTAIKPVEILPQPHPSFIVNDTIQCNHIDSFVFTNTSTISRGSMTYLWKLDSTKTSTDSNTFNTYSTAGIRTIKLTATSDSSCIDSAKQDIYVIDKPSVSLTLNSNSQCLANNSFTFANTTPASQYFTALWHLGEGDTSTNQVATKSFTKDSTFTIKLIVSKDSACGDSALTSVVVNPNPVASFSIDSTSKCQNDTFSFSNNSTINKGSIQGISWDLGDGTLTNDTSLFHNYSDSGRYTILLTAVSDSGCIDTTSKQVIALAVPTANFQINDSLQCFKTQFFEFTDLSTPSGNDSIVSYEWDLGDSTFSTLINPSHTYKDTGYYFVTLKTTNTKGCFDTARLIAAVAPEPQIDTILGKTLVLGLDTNTYTITNDTFTTYFWSVNFGTILLGPDSSSSQIIWDSVASTTNTTIKIFPINVAGCFGDTARLNVQIDPFINSIKDRHYKQLRVYPNPAKSSLFILLDNSNIKAGNVKLFDIVGKEVLTKSFSNLSQGSFELDISKLGAGTYQLLFIGNNFSAKAKVIIVSD